MTERGAKYLALFLVIGESLITLMAYSYYRLCSAVGFSMAESIASGVLWWLFLTLCWVIIVWPRDIEVKPTYSTGAAPGATYIGEKNSGDISWKSRS